MAGDVPQSSVFSSLLARGLFRCWSQQKAVSWSELFLFLSPGLLFPHLAVGTPTLLPEVRLRFSRGRVNGFLMGAVNVKVQEGNGRVESKEHVEVGS